MSDQTQEQQGVAKQQWKNILTDFLILVGIMATIGIGLKEIMGLFQAVSPSDALIAAIDDDLGTANPTGEASSQPAISKEFVTIFENASKQNANFINEVNNNGVSSLMWVCYYNVMNPVELVKLDRSRARYVSYLLEQKGLDLAAKDNQGFNALHWAAWSGFPEVCRVLVKAGIPIDLAENNGYSPLALAAKRGNDAAVKALLELGADKNVKLKDGTSLIELAEQRATAYHSSATSWFSVLYKLIYNKERDKAYSETLRLLKG